MVAKTVRDSTGQHGNNTVKGDGACGYLHPFTIRYVSFIDGSQFNMNVQLPQELLQQIFSYLSGNQNALHACSLTSPSWYLASNAYLYETPVITGKNYNAFVQAICPSVNAHVRRNGLAELVRRLDMSNLVHNGSKSLTARLLGRVKTVLEVFVAPQASFAYVLHFI